MIINNKYHKREIYILKFFNKQLYIKYIYIYIYIFLKKIFKKILKFPFYKNIFIYIFFNL